MHSFFGLLFSLMSLLVGIGQAEEQPGPSIAFFQKFNLWLPLSLDISKLTFGKYFSTTDETVFGPDVFVRLRARLDYAVSSILSLSASYSLSYALNQPVALIKTECGFEEVSEHTLVDQVDLGLTFIF